MSLQDTYNLLGREEEREMLPLCADESVQTIVYSPLARGRLARPWGEITTRSEAEAGGHAALLVASCVAFAPKSRASELLKWATGLRQRY